MPGDIKEKYTFLSLEKNIPFYSTYALTFSIKPELAIEEQVESWKESIYELIQKDYEKHSGGKEINQDNFFEEVLVDFELRTHPDKSKIEIYTKRRLISKNK